MDDDEYLTGLLYAAQGAVEDYTNRKLMAATYDYHLTDFPADGIVLPYSPIASITSVKYYSDSSTQNTVSATDYYYNIYEEPCVIRMINTPSVYEYKVEAVTVRFVTGYTIPSTIPVPLKQAIMLLVADMYEYRQASPRERFTSWQQLCYPYRVWHPVSND